MPLEYKAVLEMPYFVDIKYLSHIYLRTACSGKHAVTIFG